MGLPLNQLSGRVGQWLRTAVPSFGGIPDVRPRGGKGGRGKSLGFSVANSLVEVLLLAAHLLYQTSNFSRFQLYNGRELVIIVA